MRRNKEGLTCEQRISDRLDSRLDTIREALKNDDTRDEFEENILSVEKVTHYRVCLSYGGPADYFDIYVDTGNREITDIVYIFQDWGDSAEYTLTGKDFNDVESMFNYLAEME